MKEKICDILSEISMEIDKIDLYDYDIIEISLSTVYRLQDILANLRRELQTYVFSSKEEEMTYLSSMFNIDLGGYYDAYIVMKERKDRTAYLKD